MKIYICLLSVIHFRQLTGCVCLNTVIIARAYHKHFQLYFTLTTMEQEKYLGSRHPHCYIVMRPM